LYFPPTIFSQRRHYLPKFYERNFISINECNNYDERIRDEYPHLLWIAIERNVNDKGSQIVAMCSY